MKRVFQRFTICFWVLCLASCGDDSTNEPDEHTWSVTYRATNETIEDIIVGLSGPAVTGVTSVEFAIQAGETIELLNYDALLPSGPEVEDDFWCVSVLLGFDRTLVQQLCPVSSEQWEPGSSNSYQADFRLIITEADLEPIEDLCPRLAGVVFESETGQAIVGATVDYHGEGRFFLTTNASGRYLFYLPEGPLQGVLEVSGQGYHSVEHTLPEGVSGNSSGLYRLDFGLMRDGG
ncbi:MAG: hypothetical protein IH621_12270 [Krumholzibacteria bacterium]|nr:hypothetical protein [Candidatus Krumholzibacteria bacterium]